MKNKKETGDLKDWLSGLKQPIKDDNIPEEAKTAAKSEREERKEESGIAPEVDVNSKGEDKSIRGLSLPAGVFAHFLLIDIAGPVKEIKGVPRYMQIKTTKTFIGRDARVHILLDDPATVEVKHAKLFYEERDGEKDFLIYPIGNADINVNGETVYTEGIILKTGDRIKIGSADLIFFHKDLERNEL